MGSLAVIDLVCLGLVALAGVRGLLIGLVREAFSLAAVGAAVVVVRLGTEPATPWVLETTGLELGPLAARMVSGVGLAILTIAIVTLLGRLLRRGMRAAGLGFVDRLAGGALGVAEGSLVAALLLLGLLSVLGSNHPALAGSRSLTIYEGLERLASQAVPETADVATPPP